MRIVIVTWIISAVVMLGLSVWLGGFLKRGPTGILIDARGKYSLAHLQVVSWSLVVLSLIAGLFLARLIEGVPAALDFSIPDELLIVMGISVGGAAASTAIKAGKDTSQPDRVAASDAGDRPRLAQMLLVEEGDLADQIVDVTKFQNFWLTVIVIVAYIAQAVAAIDDAKAVHLVALPGFSGTLLTLLGVSHAGYLAGKLPNRPGQPKGLTVALKRQGAVPVRAAPLAAPATAVSYTPRNPAP